VKDPWSGQADRRMAVLHPRGRLGVNNSTLYFSIDKYSDYTAPITITSKREMNLIEAEVYWKKGDLTNAIAALNRNRTTAPASLPAFTATGLTAQDVFDRLLSERMAELFVEGHRMTDLDRFNLVAAKLGTGRARKLPLSRNEILNNRNMKQGEAKCPAIS
ncbi:MAG TPA: RagB/SusD family nutrient uptake outer membrane protein, partial [Gemmatimonadaceae bacterium]